MAMSFAATRLSLTIMWLQMAESKNQFSIRHLLLITTLCGLGVASLFVTGGYLIYFPFLVVLVLAIITWRLLAVQRRTPRPLTLRNHWPILLVLGMLTTTLIFYVPLFRMALDQFTAKQFAEKRKLATLGIQNPTEFRDIALKLHSSLIKGPVHERQLNGDSEKLPPEILSLKPLSVLATDEHLFVNMCQNRENFFGLLIFPKSTKMQHGDIKIADRIWFWETP